jgi:beta-lactamase class D
MAFLRYIPCFLFIFSFVIAEECFLLVNGISGNTVFQLGAEFEERMSPCSTFKIPLSLMGYDAGVLIDEQTPIWEFLEEYDDFLDVWKGPQSPQSWMQYSCVWYSKLISCQLGLKKMQDYLAAFDYGNQDLSVGLVMPGKADPAWFHSSPLKISPREQVSFINKMLQNKFHVSDQAVAKTKAILFKEKLQQGWKLFGKTGWSGSIGRNDNTVLEYAWFVGWIENNNQYYSFAYLTREEKIRLDQRIPRVIQLLNESGITSKE